MFQHRVTLVDGRSAIIDSVGHTKRHIKCSIEGRPFQPIRKNKIQRSRTRKKFGSLGHAMLAAAS